MNARPKFESWDGYKANSLPPEPENQWPDPEPLTQQSTAKPYPMDALPGIIGGAVREVVQIVKCPAALAANSALSVLATACQGVANVQPHGDLEPSPLSLNTVVINDSGERKTTADRKFSKVLGDWCEAKTAELEPDIRAYKAELTRWNAQKRGLEKTIESAAAKGDTESLQRGEEAREKLVWLEQNEPPPVYAPDMIMNRFTGQALYEGLRTSWPGQSILAGEAGSVFGGHGMKAENIADTMALLNECWEAGVLRSSTKSGGRHTLSGIRLTMGLAVQDSIIRQYHEKNGASARGSGWFARFLLASPESTMGTRFITVNEARGGTHNTNQLNLFHAKLYAMLEKQYENGKSGRFENLPVLQLSDDALSHWVNYFNAVEREIQAGGEMEEARDIASKSADNAARLAGLFHLFNGGDVLDAIIGETMKAACRLASWHLYEARRFFGEIALPVADLEAIKLDGWLISQCKPTGDNSIGRSHALQHSPLRKAATLNRALDTLERANRVRLTKEGRTAVIEINPALLVEVK